MNLPSHPAILPLAALLLAAAACPSTASAQIVYLNEDFEGETIGQPPANPVQRNAVQVTVAAGTGPFAGTNVADFNDIGSSGGDLEYNVGASGLSNMYISFDLLNMAPGSVGTAANPVIFGVGTWSNAAGALLNANANRAFGVEYYQTGATSTVRLRVSNSVVYSTVYTMSTIQNVEIFINDSDSLTLDYIRPDGGGTATLGADSVVVYINGTLAGASTSGYTINPAITAGDSNLGRLGFNSSSTTVTHWNIDNIYVSEAIPEPTATVLLGVAGASLLAFRRRKARPGL
jgi:hypothetical protein